MITGWKNVMTDLPGNGPENEVGFTYSVEVQNALIIGLDQYIGGHVHEVNQDWLDAQLAANTQPHIFVFGHEPAFQVQHDDCMDSSAAARNTFWSSLDYAGVRTYFCGHDHFYNRAEVVQAGRESRSLYQYVVGGGGAPLAEWTGSYGGSNGDYILESRNYVSEYGYLLVEVDQLKVTLTAYGRTGAGVYSSGGRDVLTYTVPAPVDPKPCPSDLSGDGQIDLEDLQMLADILLDAGAPFIVSCPQTSDCN